MNCPSCGSDNVGTVAKLDLAHCADCDTTTIDWLRSQLTAATAQNEKLREELRKLEWAISNRFAGGLCPQLLRPKAYYRLPR